MKRKTTIHTILITLATGFSGATDLSAGNTGVIPSAIVSTVIFNQHICSDYPADRVTSFRIRSDFHVELDEDTGWAAPINVPVDPTVDTPFRIRFEVESDDIPGRRQYGLQYRRNDGPWIHVEAHEFPYPSSFSPTISIVGCTAFFYGEEADDLLPVSELPADPGAGIALSPASPSWYPDPSTGASAEWEWALVIRHWADGAEQLVNGDSIAVRMVNQYGQPLAGVMPKFAVKVPEHHLGGTFVETPARIGPWETKEGELYFIMEPTETDNVFMMVKSTDQGKSWFEVDGENRPWADDLEGVGSVMTGDGVIHIVHQTSDHVFYHAFATSENTEDPDRWIKDSEVIASPTEPPTQVADITVRPDGSLVVVYGAGNTVHFSIRNTRGEWTAGVFPDPEQPGLTSPSILSRRDGTTDVLYKSLDGKGWSTRLTRDNRISEPRVFAYNLGTSESETVAILPLAYWPEKETTIAVFRQTDGYLYLIYSSGDKNWSAPRRISDHSVVTNAVDSEQAGADLVFFGGIIYIVYIAKEDRDLYMTKINEFNEAPESVKIVEDIEGSWVRGQILEHQSDSPVYGIIYDAGSKGGSGFNRYKAIPLYEK